MRTFRRLVALVACLLCLAPLSSAAAVHPRAGSVGDGTAPGDSLTRSTGRTRWVTLGEDLEGLEDQSSYPAALPGFDITAVKVRRIGGSIEFRFEFADLEDPLDHSPHAGVPFSISVSWWFNTQENLDDWFVGAEIDPVEQIFFLKRYDEAVRENSWVVSGAYDAAGDFVSVTVPIDLLGGAGTTLSRCRVDGGMCNDPTVAESDVRVWAHPYPHLHDADPSPTSPTGSGDPALLDYLSTDRSYKIR